jgi:hypothetical protein
MRQLIAGTLLWMAGGAAFAAGFDFDPYVAIWQAGSDVQDVVVGDVNGDRLDDVVVGSGFGAGWSVYDASLQVLLQRADGTFTPPTNYPYGNGNAGVIKVALADLNSDGVLDIVACQAQGLTLYLTNGHGGFTRADKGLVSPANACVDVAFLDIDRDGHLDIASQSGYATGTGLYYGDGRGGVRSTGYLDSPYSDGVAIDTGDATGDGIPDLIVVTTAPRVYPVRATGGFGTPLDLPAPNTDGWGIEGGAVGDFNDDGRDDIAVAVPANQPTSSVWLYLQNSNGSFLAPIKLYTYDLPTALVVADLDLDGREDLVLAHTGWFSIGRYLQGASGLGPETTNPVPFHQWRKGLATGDINDDGCTDAIVSEPSQGVLALHGNGCNLIAARNDFDGDGRSDLFWRNTRSGVNVIWSTGNSVLKRQVSAVTSQAWQVVGTGDFNGDGLSDLLWHNATTGANILWNSALSTQARPVTRVMNLAWKIVGVGDFDGDRIDDVLWRNTSTGRNVIWRSGDSGRQRPVSPVTNLAWNVAGVDDFDGDGRDDVLWRNGVTGANTIWLSADSSHGKAMAAVTDMGWKVAGTGDFDGDGEADILWRHSTRGSNSIWRSAVETRKLGVASVADVHWAVAAIGDYNGDRKADVTWRNTATGEDIIWRAAARTVEWPATDVTNPAWRIVP